MTNPNSRPIHCDRCDGAPELTRTDDAEHDRVTFTCPTCGVHIALRAERWAAVAASWPAELPMSVRVADRAIKVRVWERAS